MYKDYFFITSNVLVIYSVNGMVFSGGLLLRLDLLLKTSLRLIINKIMNEVFLKVLYQQDQKFTKNQHSN